MHALILGHGVVTGMDVDVESSVLCYGAVLDLKAKTWPLRCGFERI